MASCSSQFRSRSTASIPLFLAPAFASQSSSSATTKTMPRCIRGGQFSTSTHLRSKIGKSPISIPPEVQLRISPILPSAAVRRSAMMAAPVPTSSTQQAPPYPSLVQVEGRLGSLSLTLPPYMALRTDESGRTRRLGILDGNDKTQREMWGTTRAYLQNHILGVSEGHTAVLRLVGVGYRATVDKTAATKTAEYDGQDFVVLKVGFSHPIEMGVPKGVKATVPQPTRILLEGCDKEVVMQFAADIRAWRRPEPYKGKGIFVNNETIKLKGKKAK